MVQVNYAFQLLIFLGYFTFYDYEILKNSNNKLWLIVDGVIILIFSIFSRLGYISVSIKTTIIVKPQKGVIALPQKHRNVNFMAMLLIFKH